MIRRAQLSYVDLRILELLQENSRMPFSEIGRKLGLTDAAIHYRVKRLLANKVINRFTVEIDPASIGYLIRATFGIEVDPSLNEEVASVLARHPNFYLVWVVSGAHNIHAKAAFRDYRELQEVIYNCLHKIEGIKSYHFSILLRSVKEDFVYKGLLQNALRSR